MNAIRASRTYTAGPVIIEGKTKMVRGVTGAPNLAMLISKDDITAGDGARHDVIPGKGALANRTTCNAFRLLKACGVPLAFEEQDSPVSFIAAHSIMIFLEVVVRREAHGSYLKRNPHLKKGHYFPKLIVEFFLKTSRRKWGEHVLPCDDPLMGFKDGEIELFLPTKPIWEQEPFLTLKHGEVFRNVKEFELLSHMSKTARQAFLVLEKAWQLLGKRLVDFKVEFDDEGRISDVIDNDSWRVVAEDGRYLDKQYYRDGGGLENTKKLYELVAGLTDRFELPFQQIILWQGSGSDNVRDVFKPFLENLGRVKKTIVTCSAHKQPVLANEILNNYIQQFPDTVVISYVGRSNGLGPTLAANTMVPVITVPATIKDSPQDVWSSLRAPSNDPVMTILEPSNAALAAKQILAARNPHLYAMLRAEMEERMINFVPL